MGILAISATARRELRKALSKEGAVEAWVRISSSKDACGGLCFQLEVVGEAGPSDVVLNDRDVRIAMEAKTAERLAAARLDYVTTREGGAFAIRNTGSACSPDTCTCE